jgi:nucleoside diphosphate kinase
MVGGPVISVATWTAASWLTKDPSKHEVYCDDPYFSEGWASFLTACSDQPDEAALRHLTFLLIKPEAIVGRRIDAVLDFLSARGFFCIGTWPVRMNRHAARALWRYQINSVPIAHIRALEMGVTAGELFVLGLGHPLANSGAGSAAELLRRSKGSSSEPAAGTLRDQLRLPARMLNFAHAPDEPADVLRELAIVCESAGPSAQTLGQVIADLVGGAGRPGIARAAETVRAARTIMTSRYSQIAAHDLDVDATFERMRGYLRDRSRAGLPETTRSAIELGWLPPEHALEIVASLEGADGLPLWDRIVAAAHLTDNLSTGRPMLVLPPS